MRADSIHEKQVGTMRDFTFDTWWFEDERRLSFSIELLARVILRWIVIVGMDASTRIYDFKVIVIDSDCLMIADISSCSYSLPDPFVSLLYLVPQKQN